MNSAINPQLVLETCLRRKWLIVIPVALGLLASILLVRTLPKFYRSQSLIVVRPSELSREFVRSPVEYDVRRDLQNIEEQILSRSWMERVVRDLGLVESDSEGRELDGLVRTMLQHVDVDRNSRTSFTISFVGKDPSLVYQVVEALTSLFVHENLEQAVKADADAAFYLDEEISTVEAELSTKEDTLAEYKRKYMGELPEQIDSNQRMLERLQIQQQINSENLRDARNRRLLVESQLPGIDGGTPSGTDDILLNQLLEARRELETLKTQFTEHHPDVINIEAKVNRLENQLRVRSEESGPGSDGAGSNQQADSNPYNMAMNSELKNVVLEIARLDEEKARLTQDIATYERRVEAAFNRQQELTQLTRDYDNLEEYYRTLLDRKLNTRLSSRVLKTHSANQYEILDPPREPRTPFKPDPLRILFLGLVGGLGLGGAIAFGLEFLGDRFYRAGDLEEQLGISVLATIPLLEDSRESRRRRIRLIVLLALVVLTAGGAIVFNMYVVDLVDLLREALNRYFQ